MSFLDTVNVVNKQLLKATGSIALPDLSAKHEAIVDHPHISTGSFVVDYVTGIGGVPRGKMTEFHGLQSAGKTTCSLMTAAECQSMGLGVLFLDFENSFVSLYARTLGVDLSPSKFALYQPKSMEDGFKVARVFIGDGDCGLVIADSVAAMVPQSEVDGELGDSEIGAQSRAMSRILRQMKHEVSVHQVAMLFINQLRDVIDLTWAGQQAARRKAQYTTPGGRALKFFADMRLEFMPLGQESVEGESALSGIGSKEKEKTKIVIGQKAKVTAVKNKCAAPFKSEEIFLRSGKGIDSTKPCIDLALKYGLIKGGGAGGYFKVPQPYCDPTLIEQTIQGRESLEYFFESHSAQLNALFSSVWEFIKTTGGF